MTRGSKNLLQLVAAYPESSFIRLLRQNTYEPAAAFPVGANSKPITQPLAGSTSC
jgi:hypothetical protein